MLQDVSSEVLPAQFLPPQYGVGLVQDLVIKDEPGKPMLVCKVWWFHLDLVLVPPPQDLLQAP